MTSRWWVLAQAIVRDGEIVADGAGGTDGVGGAGGIDGEGHGGLRKWATKGAGRPKNRCC